MVGAGMKPLSGFIKLIPLPVVAAVVIVATIDVMPSPGEMSKYWRWSFTDWATFLITFNTTLIVTPETGLEVGGAILAIYTLFRMILSRPRTVQCPDLESQYGTLALPIWEENDIPQGVFIMRFEHDLMFANAERIKKSIVDNAMMTHSAVPSICNKNDRAWNDCIDKHVKYLRRRAGIRGDDHTLPRLQIVVLDLSTASFIDSSGVHAIEDIKSQLRVYGGSDVEFRFVGLRDALRRRFDRAKWNLASPYDEDQETTADEEKTPADYVFDHVHHAIRMPSKRRVDSPTQEPLAWEKDDISIVNIGRPAVVARDMI
ncbi:hypothetical protein NM208_g11247 [Fusarium decemcellulare]|uniref:Uncharacterized protein n=1 Tax=Fusarium decemcellulare TaxID=57161 RepID=A0ACC1RV13_9HYPO|nr:hypothetical protein NM208_g11247 [Fusarium decemcellulare]